jgi:hypothetical protein
MALSSISGLFFSTAVESLPGNRAMTYSSMIGGSFFVAQRVILLSGKPACLSAAPV